MNLRSCSQILFFSYFHFIPPNSNKLLHCSIAYDIFSKEYVTKKKHNELCKLIKNVLLSAVREGLGFPTLHTKRDQNLIEKQTRGGVEDDCGIEYLLVDKVITHWYRSIPKESAVKSAPRVHSGRVRIADIKHAIKAVGE